MKIFPAIDIMNGEVVRLTQGDYNRKKVYSLNPSAVMEGFKTEGAEYLHAVDLDGAKNGTLSNYETVKTLTNSGIFVEIGGGIRDFERIEKYLDIGVGRVILGTIAVKRFSFVEEAVKKYGEAIAVGVDAYRGKVAVNGWMEITFDSSVEFCKKLADAGVKTIIYTDISKDGKLEGTNLNVYEELKTLNVDIIASGGISFEYEISELKDMGISGAILGKALYEGKLSLKRVIEIAK